MYVFDQEIVRFDSPCQKEAFISVHSLLSLWCPCMHLPSAPCERKRSHFRFKSSFIFYVSSTVLHFFLLYSDKRAKVWDILLGLNKLFPSLFKIN